MIAPMESYCLPFSQIPRTTKLFSTFLDDFSRVSHYYAHPPTQAGVDSAAREVRLDPGVRRAVLEILRQQNRGFAPGGEVDSATSRNLERFASGAVAVVTGQQVGLFSGPAYTFYKALTAIRCAEEITRRGIDAVPIFWLASEDHDLAEVNHSSWCTRNGLARYEVPPPSENAGHRVGEIVFGDAVQSIVGSVVPTLNGSFANEIGRALQESYTPRSTYAVAFGKLMTRLLPGRGLILLDQFDPRLHQLSRASLDSGTLRTDLWRDALLARRKDLENAGFHSQVKVTGETTLVFWSRAGRREPIRAKNGAFLVGDSEVTARGLRDAISGQPQEFSPSALLRPVIQDTLLPTAAYIAGPAEVAYMAQTQVVYQGLGVPMPAILPRSSFTLVEPPIARFLAQYDADLRDVLAGRQHLREKMEQKTLPSVLASRFDEGEAELHRLMDSLEEPLAKLDSTLVESLHGTEAKMLHQLSQLKGKVGRAQNLRSGVLDRHERILLDSLAPQGELQERTLSFLPFLSEHGPALLDELISRSSVADSGQGKSCATQHQVFLL